jgi:hypothetical protein
MKTVIPRDRHEGRHHHQRGFVAVLFGNALILALAAAVLRP